VCSSDLQYDGNDLGHGGTQMYQGLVLGKQKLPVCRHGNFGHVLAPRFVLDPKILVLITRQSFGFYGQSVEFEDQRLHFGAGECGFVGS